MLQPIVFYDIPSNSKAKAWSPNTWKTRYTLNVKGLPYKTVWVEYPDIEPLCKKIGAAATENNRNGSLLYTLPVIYDPNTETIVPDSGAIVRYLDKTYPDTPTLIPPQADTLIAAFERAFWGAHKPDWGFVPIIMRAAFSQLRAGSQPFFRETREMELGRLEDLAPDGSEKREECWVKTEKALGNVAKWWEADGKEKTFVMGDVVSYADIIVASWFLWFREGLGEESAEWKRMMGWHNGRWARILEALEKYSAVDEGEDLQL